MEPLQRQRLDSSDDGVEAVHAVQHEGALGTGELASTVPAQVPAQDVGQEQLQVQFGRRVEDPAALVPAELSGANTAALLHLARV